MKDKNSNSDCDCGAKYTSFPDIHLDWCLVLNPQEDREFDKAYTEWFNSSFYNNNEEEE